MGHYDSAYKTDAREARKVAEQRNRKLVKRIVSIRGELFPDENIIAQKLREAELLLQHGLY